MKRRLLVAVPLLAVLCGRAEAQSSASFRLTEQVLNAGGHPLDGARPASAGFVASLDALGDAVAGSAFSSASYRGSGGFVLRYAPPGEVHGVQFPDKSSVAWSAEPSVGTYNVYRNGACHQAGLSAPSAVETDVPPPDSAWQYLVTAANRLREEGTMGRASSGAERGIAAPCP